MSPTFERQQAISQQNPGRAGMSSPQSGMSAIESASVARALRLGMAGDVLQGAAGVVGDELVRRERLHDMADYTNAMGEMDRAVARAEQRISQIPLDGAPPGQAFDETVQRIYKEELGQFQRWSEGNADSGIPNLRSRQLRDRVRGETQQMEQRLRTRAQQIALQRHQQESERRIERGFAAAIQAGGATGEADIETYSEQLVDLGMDMAEVLEIRRESLEKLAESDFEKRMLAARAAIDLGGDMEDVDTIIETAMAELMAGAGTFRHVNPDGAPKEQEERVRELQNRLVLRSRQARSELAGLVRQREQEEQLRYQEFVREGENFLAGMLLDGADLGAVYDAIDRREGEGGLLYGDADRAKMRKMAKQIAENIRNPEAEAEEARERREQDRVAEFTHEAESAATWAKLFMDSQLAADMTDKQFEDFLQELHNEVTEGFIKPDQYRTFLREAISARQEGTTPHRETMAATMDATEQIIREIHRRGELVTSRRDQLLTERAGFLGGRRQLNNVGLNIAVYGVMNYMREDTSRTPEDGIKWLRATLDREGGVNERLESQSLMMDLLGYGPPAHVEGEGDVEAETERLSRVVEAMQGTSLGARGPSRARRQATPLAFIDAGGEQ